MPQPPSAAPRDEPVIRDRGDACPGALRPHAADDGFLARIRIPGGLLDGPAALLLAEAADRLGDGHIDLTSRGNAQLRGLGASCGGELESVLARAGLLPAPTHERVRNVVASPLTGLDRAGLPDVSAWVAELDRLLCASPAAAELSGRFLFALDDGRGDVVALDGDITLAAHGTGGALLWTSGARRGVVVAASEAPRAALAAALYFLDAVRASGTRAWRVGELPPEHALDVTELARRVGRGGEVADVPGRPPGPAPTPALGPIAGGPGGTVALSVLAPLGRLSTAQWSRLAGLTGRMRLTPWRGIVVPGLPAEAAPRALADLAAAGLVTSAEDPWRSVTACTGQPGCAKSRADVRADARSVVERSVGQLPVHWSGCERRCGHPRGAAWVDLVATPDGYALTAPGRTPATTPRKDLAALADALRAARTTPATDPSQ
ncbi:precorrin-3B synthase [Streptomyces sp. NPDC101733]|uniref:precorrin-3B synthase n=1 Tax=unclassified Streptomyces TaxID=2593676 RepID=UPI0038148023